MADPAVELDYVTGIGGVDAPPPFISHLLPPDVADRQVRFAGGGSAELPPVAPRARVYRRLLERLWQMRHPVFAELDEHRVITDLFVPFVGRVVRLDRARDGSFYVGLSTSAIRFVLAPGHRHFSALLKDLKLAKGDRSPRIISATSDRHVIVDVREDRLLWFDVRRPRDGEFVSRPVLGSNAIARASAVSQRRAETLFAGFAPASCDLPEDQPGCIPFLYPDDGCWARAHEVCTRLERDHGLTAVKVWIHGDNLGIRTRNSPECRVSWNFHVAPALRLAGRPEHLLMFDHAIFDGPRTRTEWKRAIGDRDAEISVTESIIWSQETKDVFQTEPAGQQAFDLNTYRVLLEERVDEEGAPPYDFCRL
jgi:hypothetical protein